MQSQNHKGTFGQVTKHHREPKVMQSKVLHVEFLPWELQVLMDSTFGILSKNRFLWGGLEVETIWMMVEVISLPFSRANRFVARLGFKLSKCNFKQLSISSL